MKKRKKSSLVPWAVDSRSLIRWAQKGLPARYKNKTMYLNGVNPCSLKASKEMKCGENIVALFDHSTSPATIYVTHMDNIDLLI